MHFNMLDASINGLASHFRVSLAVPSKLPGCNETGQETAA